MRKENLAYGRILTILSCSKQGSAGTFQGRFHRFRKAFPHILRQLNSVYDYFNCVFFLFIKLYPVFEVYKEAVYTGTHKTSGDSITHYLLVFSLFSLYNGSENLNAGSFRPAHNGIYNLVNRLLLNFFSARRTVGMAGTGKKEAVVVVNFGYRSDRGAGVAVCSFLFYRNSRRKPLDVIHIGLIHSA